MWGANLVAFLPVRVLVAVVLFLLSACGLYAQDGQVRYRGISSLKKGMVVDFDTTRTRVLTVIDKSTVQLLIDMEDERLNGSVVVKGMATEDLVTDKKILMPRWCKVVGKYTGRNVLGVRLDVWELQAAKIRVVEQKVVKRFMRDVATVTTVDGKTYKGVDTTHYQGRVAGTNKIIYKVLVRVMDRYVWLEPEKIESIRVKNTVYTFDKDERKFKWEGVVKIEVPEF